MSSAKYNLAVGPAPGEATLTILPRGWRGDGSKTGLVYCHGYTADLIPELEARNPAVGPGMYRILNAIADRLGLPIVSLAMGSPGGTGNPPATPAATNPWGNPTGVNRVGLAKAYLQGAAVGAAPGKVALFGQSMGHLSVMNYAAANLGSVACVVSSMGVADLNNIHGQATYLSSIDTAFGGTWTQAANGATSNPLTQAQAGKFAGLPWRGYVGTADTTAPLAQAQSLAAAIGATASVVPIGGAVHDWNAVAQYPLEDLLAFLDTYTS